MAALFIPGWAARASLYRDALPPGWEVLQPPSFRSTGGAIEAYPAWLSDELVRRNGPFTLGGHSFGAALAVLAAARGDADVERLVLVEPAGLPLFKPKIRALRDFGRQLAADSDTLTPPDHCRRVADLAGATFEQLAVAGGHVWFLVAGPQLRARLA